IHVIRRAALEGALRVVPGPDGPERYVALEAALPDDCVDPDRAGVELARRYLAANGPATVDDLAAWSGLPAATVRRSWAAIAEERNPVDGPDGTAWVLAARAEAVAADADRPLPLRLTGGFDPLWLGYADRTLHLSAGHAPEVNRGGGMVKPLVVSDGAVIGTWASRRVRTRHVVEVDPFRRLTRPETAAVGAEVADIGRFLATSPELVLGAR
ncbi:MAG: winged helix DNA-binding domain-containing protein, partial [Actinomycetota bacterium]|nr:winged helix DNA-binding domain-containing protein [Actinomycetota bacterium]